ncbi:MAG: glycosyltransferase family 4 protein [Planctomycetota bacterium]
MKIFHVGTSISLNQVVLDQMVDQLRRGHEVVALCPRDEWARRIRDCGVRLLPAPFVRHDVPATLQAGIETFLACRKERPDIVHTHNSLPGIVGRMAARLAGGAAVIHTCHAWPLHLSRSRLFTLSYLALERLAARMAGAVLFQNPDDRFACVSQGIVPPWKAVWIGNGIDLEALDAATDGVEREKVRNTLGLSSDTFVISMVARLEPLKGHAFFLRTFQALLERTSRRVVALLAGFGSHGDLLRQEVARLGLDKAVRFLGYRSDIPAFLLASDLTVLTSLYEGLPRALMEAMALRRPVVATDVPGTRSVVKDGLTGFLVPYGDVEGFVRAVGEIMGNTERALAMGAVGRARVEEHFNARRVHDRILAVYEHLLEKRPGPLPNWEPED